MKRAWKKAAPPALIRTLFVFAASGMLSMWTFASLANPSIRKTLEGHKYAVVSVAYSPDGKTLASGSLDSSIRIWNLKTGKTLRTLEGHTDALYAVVYSPDGSQLVVCSGDDTIRIWDAARFPEKGD